MRSHHRVLACIIFVSLLMTCFAECAGISGGRFFLTTPVLAGEHFKWGSSSTAEKTAAESIETNKTDKSENDENNVADEPQNIADDSLAEQSAVVNLYADSYKVLPYNEREVEIEISGLLPVNCNIDAYPVNFVSEGMEVIEAWDVTIFRPDGSVYEPGDNPVRMTITSEALRQLSAGQVEIYHISGPDDGTETAVSGDNEDILKENGEQSEETISQDGDGTVSEEKSEQSEEAVNADGNGTVPEENGEQSKDTANADNVETEPVGNREQLEDTVGMDNDGIDLEETEDRAEEIVGADSGQDTVETAGEINEVTIDSLEAVDENLTNAISEEPYQPANEAEDSGLQTNVPDCETPVDLLIEESGETLAETESLEVTADDGTPLSLELIETVEIVEESNSISFEVKEFSGVAAVRANASQEMLLGAGPSTDVEALDTSEIIDINMFNYTAYDDANIGSGNNINLSDNRIKTGINVDSNGNFRDFRFYSSGVKSQDTSTEKYYFPYTSNQGTYATYVTTGQNNNVQTGTNQWGYPTYTNYYIPKIDQLHSINNYTGGHSDDKGNQSTPVPMQGIVQNQLYDSSGQPKSDGTGYPYLAYGAWQGAYNQEGSSPAYSAGNTAASLQYLFDPNTSVNGKTSYAGVNYLFYDEDGYFTYDSKAYYAYLQANNEFMLLDSTYKPGFFPFNPYTDAQASKSVGPGKGYDDHFGMTLNAKFNIPLGGIITKDNGETTEEKFIFSGDDDLWVFVDGKLVLDIGGVHQPIYGSINFATGEVIVNNEHNGNVATVNTVGFSSVTQKTLQEILGSDFNKDPYAEHTIQVFYLERGSNDSNLRVQFNLPMVRSIDVGKKVTGDDAASYTNEEFKFQLFLQDLTADMETYKIFNPHAATRNLDSISAAVTAGTVTDPGAQVKEYYENTYLDNLKISIGVEDTSGNVTYTELTKAEVRTRFGDDGTFTLKHNEHLKINSLIEYQKYYVKELLDGDRFETSVDGSPGNQTVTDTVQNKPTSAFENRTIKRKINVEKEWEDVPEDYRPDAIKVSITQKDSVYVHFRGYDDANTICVPSGVDFPFRLSLTSDEVSWDRIKVTANGTELTGADGTDSKTYTIPGTVTVDPVDVYVSISPRVVDYNSSGTSHYVKRLEEYQAGDYVAISTDEVTQSSEKTIVKQISAPANASDAWTVTITDPSDLGEKLGHYYEYEIKEISVIKGSQEMSLSEAGYIATVTGPVESDEAWASDTSKVGAHELSFTVTNKFKDVDITLIKTSSVELPQGGDTTAYEILPGVEFTLYERTVTTEQDPETGNTVEVEVLTPVKTDIISDDGQADDPNDAEAVAEAAARKGKVFLTGLKRGSTYYLEETKAADGYFLPEGGWTIAVGYDGKVTITGQDEYAAAYTVPESGEFAGCYRISNVKMYELPSTGGPGDYLFTIIGIAISTVVILLKLRERSEKRAA